MTDLPGSNEQHRFPSLFQGLRDTLATIDDEMPRSPDSISNRQQLMKTLHIEKLVRKNKVSDKGPTNKLLPLRSLFLSEINPTLVAENPQLLPCTM